MSLQPGPIEITVLMPLFSKARPRVTSRGTFMPKAYKDNQKEMLKQIKAQYFGEPLTGPLKVVLELRGEGRADIDNMVGAFFDVANKVLWVDDRVSIIPELSVSWTKAKKDQSRWLVKIYDLNEAQGDLGL
jgi:Holliday junction resolvase RusA-like endonuclease